MTVSISVGVTNKKYSIIGQRNKPEPVTPVTLPWAGAAVEEDLVTGTVVRPGNRNNIQLESVSDVTMHEK